MHKGFKCLDVSEGRVYISRDVVFDESVYPFARLHPNAGARLRSEILLLPPSLLNSSYGDNNISGPSGNDSLCTNPVVEHADFAGNLDSNDQDASANGGDFMQPVALPFLASPGAGPDSDSPTTAVDLSGGSSSALAPTDSVTPSSNTDLPRVLPSPLLRHRGDRAGAL